METSSAESLMASGTIAVLAKALRSGELSSQRLTQWCLDRIARFNPALNAVRTISARALDDALKADAELAGGIDRGPLHGIPYLLKDNICTGDGMPTSAGVAALADWRPAADATLVTRLRLAGAVLLGKTNLTELADYVSDVMPAEFSGAGGVVRNPHGLRYDRGQGSSIGSAAAVAAGLCVFAIGSETQNSLQTPASHSSVVGFKPTVGTVSRYGVVPLVPSQDSPGPLTRTVADAHAVFQALTIPDLRDTLTLAWPRAAQPGPAVAAAALRLGVPRRAFADREDHVGHAADFARVLARLAGGGVTLLDPCDLEAADEILAVRSSVFRTEFKAAFNAFLADHGAPQGIGTLADLIRFNDAHPQHIPYGQSLLVAAEATRGIDDPTYLADRAQDLTLTRSRGIDGALGRNGADALLLPMTVGARLSGKAGAPVVAVPCGAGADGAPFAVTVIGRAGDDAKVLAAARVIEELAGGRIVPAL
ncbi:MAG TPA: amidase family protein [Burkholderiaceae bacterium]|nr:amidase family protein [Burkholderiaceae bacterium]